MLRSGFGGRHEETDGAAEGSPAISAYAVPTGTCQRDGMPGGDMRSVTGHTANRSAFSAEPGPAGRAIPRALARFRGVRRPGTCLAARRRRTHPIPEAPRCCSRNSWSRARCCRSTSSWYRARRWRSIGSRVPASSLTARPDACQAIRRTYPPSCPAQRSGARGPALSGRAAECPARALRKHRGGWRHVRYPRAGRSRW
jgi:hypothetical protein